MRIDMDLRKEVLRVQRKELTQHIIYKRLASIAALENNRKIFEDMARDEKRQHDFLAKISGARVRPETASVFFYILAARFVGPSFSLKLMERKRNLAKSAYTELKKETRDIDAVIKDGEEREKKNLNLIEEEKVRYTDSMILGLNDGLVELVGGLAGFTLALRDADLIAATGFIMGMAGSLSIGGSEYLSTRDKGDKNPVKASIYAGSSFFLVVAMLIVPYFFIEIPLLSLGIALLLAISLIALFNYYLSVAKNLSFKKRFAQMFFVSMGVAAVNFVLGIFIRNYLNIKV
jgi:VIT1/CCC1 family predicted Fe2+/Mn2+ transporter